MSGIIEARPVKSEPVVDPAEQTKEAQLEHEISQIEEFLDELQIEYDDIKQQLQEETELAVAWTEENRTLVNILQE